MQSCVPFLDDVSSYGHLAMGSITSTMPVWGQLLVSLGFLLYQIKECGEPIENKIGDLAEFSSGYLAGKLVKEI